MRQILSNARDPEVPDFSRYADLPNGMGVNRAETDKIVTDKLGRDGNYAATALTFYDGKIFLGNPLDYPDPKAVINRKNWLVNVNAWHGKKALAASGKAEEAAHIEPFSELFKGMMEEAYRYSKILRDNYIPARQVLSAAGPLLQTAYETVRRTNWLTEVKGPKYNLSVFNATNVVTVRNTTDLNMVGFTRSGKLAGTPEIGDNQIPELSQNTFASYDKFMYADSFRYEFGMREKRESVPDVEAQVTQDIPGVFAKMKDDKVTTLANGVTGTTPTTDWDSLTGEHYTNQADKDIEDADNTLVDYGGAMSVLWPRAVANAYRRNVNGAPGPLRGNSVALPESAERKRQWNLPLNEHIIGYINGTINTGEAVVISDQWATLFQGPTIQVNYKNVMTPMQVEGRILFDFNGVKEQVAAAATRLQGLLS